ncbi:hypothetical protein ACFWMV_03215 [Streptomyces mutabilis]|uniref:hypothetical protein n=1 Tax=Streptomyces mutabilis TaxID=67332 RepID=UPI003658BF80
MIAFAAAVAAAAVAATLTATVTGDDEAKPAPTVTVTETTVADGADSAADTGADPAPEDDGGDAHGFADTVTYENDVEVNLTGFGRGTSSEYASPEKMPYAEFTIKIVNRSDTTVDASQLTVNCAYGEEGREGEAIYDDGFDGLPDTRILAGRSLSVPWACELPKDERFLQVEVAPDWDSETAIFTGNVK